MNFNQAVVKFISILTREGEISGQFLTLDGQSAKLLIDGEPFVEINEESILLFGKEDVSRKIFSDSTEKNFSHVDFAELEKLCSQVDIVRLNHLGISYVCEDVESEIDHFKNLLVGTKFKIYEEESGFSNQRWFFICNLDSQESPIFELVLTKKIDASLREWVPHFQIDIDTSQSIEELRGLTAKFIKPEFFDWELDFPDWGVVLGMGKLGNINGTKICLGLGTNLRDTKKHREEILKKVK